MSRRGASNWPDNTASQNMFLNISSSITTPQRRRSMDLIFAIQANDREFFVSRMDAVASQFYGRLFEVGQCRGIEYLWLTAQQVIRRVPGLATRRASPVVR